MAGFQAVNLSGYLQFRLHSILRFPHKYPTASNHPEEFHNDQDAIDVFQELTRQYPKSQLAAFALFRMAECYHHGYGPAGEPLLQKGIPQAINIYQNLVQQYPNSEVASISQILTGILYSQIGKHLEAVDEYNKAFKLFPNILPSPQFTHLLPYTSSLGDVGISPIGALALYLIGEHYEKTGHTKEALEVFAQIVANYLPNYPNSTIVLTAAYHQIEILWKTQQLKKMVAISEDLIRDCPKEGVIFFGTWHEGVTVRICDMEGVPRSLFDAYNKLGMHEKAKQLQEQYPGM